MRRRSFEHPSLLASHAFHHAFVASRTLGLLPRDHESQYGGNGLKYDGEEHRGEEGTRNNGQERQQGDRYNDEEDMEGIGMSHSHRHSGPEPADSYDGTSSHDSSREGLEDERFGPYANESPKDSTIDHFPYGSPSAPTNEVNSHSVTGSTQDTSESDEAPNFPSKHPLGDESHEPDPAPRHGQVPPPDEITPAQHVVSSSISNEGTSTVCSTLSRLYEQLDGSAWYNQEGWKDTTTPHRIRGRDHEASSESQRPFRTSAQTDEDAIGGQDEDQGDEASTDRGTTSDRNEDPVVVNEDNNGLSCCSWFGVICRGSRVVGLALARNGLNGPYPTDVVQSLAGLETV